ncbi:hypothetical protein SAMN02910356_00080 [Selenomonas sp. GACV-9]|uniref:hypothetical protein n=1 Tax=Selenomonas sp. GACV-9 TaxID=3158782 RepID=UPI0008EC5DA5|nr:hypothetical protein SAMN02910356_00080 [Selenomonas ruminantium]
MQTIERGKDGVYRWVYELNLYTNPTIFLLVSKIFLGIAVAINIFILLLDVIENGFRLELLEDLAFGFACFVVGMLLLTAVGYLVYAFIMGGKYCVLFEMDEQGVKHTQLPHQIKKAQAIGILALLAGASAGNLTTMGSGLLAASRSSTYSRFRDVKSIEVLRSRNVIKLNEPMNYNQVYAADEDFAFVLDFIQARVK